MSRRPRKKQLQSAPKPTRRRYWPRNDILAVSGIIIAIISVLLSLSLPEVRRLIGLERSEPISINKPMPTNQPIYRLKQAYSGHEIPVIPTSEGINKETADIVPIRRMKIIWESPDGDTVGYILDGEDRILCSFEGQVTQDMHFLFQCANSNQKFDGYIYQEDGHIKGVMKDGSSMGILWEFREGSRNFAPVKAPTPESLPTPPVPHWGDGYHDPSPTPEPSIELPLPLNKPTNND